MPFWMTWFFVGAFLGTTAVISAQNASSVAAFKTPPPIEQHLDQGYREAN